MEQDQFRRLFRELQLLRKGLVGDGSQGQQEASADLADAIAGCTHYRGMSLTKTERVDIRNYLEEIRNRRGGG